MNYKRCFEVVFGSEKLGPFEDEMEARTAAHAFWKTTQYVLLTWYIPEEARAPEVEIVEGANGEES